MLGNLLMVMALWQFNRANDPFMAIYGYGSFIDGLPCLPININSKLLVYQRVPSGKLT